MTREVITAKDADAVVDVARIISESKVRAVSIIDSRGTLRVIIAEIVFFAGALSLIIWERV